MHAACDCPVCGSNRTLPAGTLPLALRSGALRTTVRECVHCRSFWRTLPESADLLSHFDAPRSTTAELRDGWPANRLALFTLVARIAEGMRSRWPTSPALLDVGFGRGHLLEHFARLGFSSSGVEPVARLRDRLRDRGTTVWARLADVKPEERRYDLITFLDTLYYFDRPFEALAHAVSLLSREGVILVRTANRTPFLRLLRPLRDHAVFGRVFGDQVVALSHRGVLEMIRRVGARLERSYFYEARQDLGRTERLLYRGLGIVAAVTRLPISPGILYVISRR